MARKRDTKSLISGGVHGQTGSQWVTDTIRLRHFRTGGVRRKCSVMAARSTAEPHTASNLATESNSPACVRRNPDQHQNTEGKIASWAGVWSTNNQVINCRFYSVWPSCPSCRTSTLDVHLTCHRSFHRWNVRNVKLWTLFGRALWFERRLWRICLSEAWASRFVWLNSITGSRPLKAAVTRLPLKVHIPAQHSR